MRFIAFIILLLSTIFGNASNSYVDKVPIINIANILLQEPNEQSLRETCDYYNLLSSDQKIALNCTPSDNLLLFERKSSGEKIVIKPETRDGRRIFQVFVLGLKNKGNVSQMLEALGDSKQSSSLYSSGLKRCEIQQGYIRFYLVVPEPHYVTD